MRQRRYPASCTQLPISYFLVTRLILVHLCLPLFAILAYSSVGFCTTRNTGSAPGGSTHAVSGGSLQLKIPVSHSLVGAERVSYVLSLESGQFVRLVCTPFNLDVVLSVVSPETQKVVELDTTDGSGGQRTLFWIAKTPGQHLVQVRSAHKTASKGSYQLELEESKPATTQEAGLIEAQDNFLAAERLRRAGDGDSLHQSLPKYQHAAEIWETTKQLSLKAKALRQNGFVLFSVGQNQQALQPLNEALSLARSVGDRTAESAALHTLGEAHYYVADYQEALGLFNRCLPMQLSDDFAPQRADTVNDIAVVYDDMGHAQTALGYYGQALTLKHQVGNRADEASILGNIAIVYDNLGDKQTALRYYKAALATQTALHNLRGEGLALNNVGTLYHSLGDQWRALEYYSQALPLFEKTGDRQEKGRALSNIARSYAQLARTVPTGP